MTCSFLGSPTEYMVRVRCKDRPMAREEVSQCNHPEHKRVSGESGVCLCNWPGPWDKDQGVEASIFQLCKSCEFHLT